VLRHRHISKELGRAPLFTADKRGRSLPFRTWKEGEGKGGRSSNSICPDRTADIFNRVKGKGPSRFHGERGRGGRKKRKARFVARLHLGKRGEITSSPHVGSRGGVDL